MLGLIKVDTAGNLRLVRPLRRRHPGLGWLRHQPIASVGDFDGDGRDDLLVTNFTDWAMPYVATLQSTGTG